MTQMATGAPQQTNNNAVSHSQWPSQQITVQMQSSNPEMNVRVLAESINKQHNSKPSKIVDEEQPPQQQNRCPNFHDQPMFVLLDGCKNGLVHTQSKAQPKLDNKTSTSSLFQINKLRRQLSDKTPNILTSSAQLGQPSTALTTNPAPHSPPTHRYYLESIAQHHRNPSSPIIAHIGSTIEDLAHRDALIRRAQQSQSGAPRVDLPRREQHQDRMTVVFDLDETLVYSRRGSADAGERVSVADPLHSQCTAHYSVMVRPYARECLQRLSAHFELIIFTASSAAYADAVLLLLDPTGALVSHRLYNQHCHPFPAKDLRLLGRPLSHTVMVDNRAYSYLLQLDNGIPILPFLGDCKDNQLMKLCEYVEGLQGRDVREANRQMFGLGAYRGGVAEVLAQVYDHCVDGDADLH